MTSAAHYTVLARRFRPQSFDDVIGQQHVAVALKNAIRHGRVAHAYLFTGARGVGKTSMARILAKALNCPKVADGVPCHQCDICEAIASGNDVDVLEIDGASNRGIDDIRQLRANVNVKSMRGRFKIYIIDEVHMLTTDAFNALLKTLEEPPPNVKFVFCTTEPEKLLDTILSRCQRFDFALVESGSIAERLTEIATAEGFEMTPAAVELVARRAAGSMRDSQSLLDQLLAFADDTIDAEDVHRLLGTASDDWLMEMIAALVARDRSKSLVMTDDALSSGVQLGEVVDQLLRTLRDVMLLASQVDTVGLLGVGEANRTQLKQLAESWGLANAVAAVEILSETKSRLARASHGRVLLDLAVIRICLLEDLSRLHDLLSELQQQGDSVSLPETRSARQLVDRSASASNSEDPVEVHKNTAVEPSNSPVPESEKKKLDTPIKIAQSPSVAENLAETTPVQQKTPENLLSQVVSLIDNKIGVHLQKASLAIFGPNDLELSFSRSYDFSRSICVKPENLSRIEAAFSRLLEEAVSVRVAETDTAAATTGGSSASIRENETSTSQSEVPEADEHPFISAVLDVFNAKLITVERHRITTEADRRPADEEESEIDGSLN